MDADEVRRLFLDFSRAGKVLSGDEDALCSRMAEALKAALVEKSTSMLCGARNQAVLFSYASDATSFLVQEMASTKLGELSVVRKGKLLHEVLLQRGLLVTIDPAGNRSGALVLRDRC